MDNELILPWSKLMESSRDELLHLYNEQKAKQVRVLFQNKEGLWLLNNKAEVILMVAAVSERED